MGFAVNSRGAELYAHLARGAAGPFDRDYASAAIALVTEADEELLRNLHAHGGRIDNVTGSALAFIVLVDQATVVGKPNYVPRGAFVDDAATNALFRLPARGFVGERTLTEHVKQSDAVISGPCSFVINAQSSTVFARKAGIPLKHLPCLAVIDRGSDVVGVVAQPGWPAILDVLYDAASEFYVQNSQHPFVRLSEAADALARELQSLDRAREVARSRVDWRIYSDGVLCLDWLYQHSVDSEDFYRGWREVVQQPAEAAVSPPRAAALKVYWQQRTLNSRQRQIYQTIGRAKLTDGRLTAEEYSAASVVWHEVNAAVGRERRDPPNEADFAGWLRFWRDTAPLLRGACRTIARQCEVDLIAVDRDLVADAELESELPGSRARRTELSERKADLKAQLSTTPAPSLVGLVERETGRKKLQLTFFRLKLAAAGAATFITDLLRAVAALPT